MIGFKLRVVAPKLSVASRLSNKVGLEIFIVNLHSVTLLLELYNLYSGSRKLLLALGVGFFGILKLHGEVTNLLQQARVLFR